MSESGNINFPEQIGQPIGCGVDKVRYPLTAKHIHNLATSAQNQRDMTTSPTRGVMTKSQIFLDFWAISRWLRGALFGILITLNVDLHVLALLTVHPRLLQSSKFEHCNHADCRAGSELLATGQCMRLDAISLQQVHLRRYVWMSLVTCSDRRGKR